LKKITVANYRQDPYYARIVKEVEGLLREKGFVAPLELFVRMDLLSPESVENWRRGRIAYLERSASQTLASRKFNVFTDLLIRQVYLWSFWKQSEEIRPALPSAAVPARPHVSHREEPVHE